MNGFGAKVYSRVAVESGAGGPHALVLMLFDGALAATRLALGHLQAGRIAEKAAALSKSSRIVEEGLKASLDRSAGGELGTRLSDLYDYMTMRLLQANLRNDAKALAEVIRLLEGLRDAWAQIGRAVGAAVAQGGTAPAVTPAPPVAPVPTDLGAPGTARRFPTDNLPAPRRVAVA